MKSVSFLAIAFLLVAACNESVTKRNLPEETLVLPRGGLDFALIKERVLGPRCLQCHAYYNDYANVRGHLSAIRSAVESDRMPKQSLPLSAPQKELLFSWIEAGAPELGSGVPPDQKPTPLEPNYASITALILVPKCLSCHNPQGQAKFLDLSTRQSIFQARNRLFGAEPGKPLLNFDNPEQSYLIEILNDPVEPMPPIWSNLPRLDPDEIKIMTEWIGLGIP